MEEDKEPIVYDHPEHTVTVESVGGVTVEQMDLHAAHGGIGENQVRYPITAADFIQLYAAA